MHDYHNLLLAHPSSVGFYECLRSKTATWSDKVKLVRYGWKHDTVFLPNKHQLLLDWLTAALSGRKALRWGSLGTVSSNTTVRIVYAIEQVYVEKVHL